MSGIFGIFHKHGQAVVPTTLDAIATAMVHWGPDGRGCWCEGEVGLGHLMLHNTPESQHEQAPLQHPAYPQMVITAAARIDNRDELFERLAIAGVQRAMMTDSELILHAYARWGEACPQHLLGAYAFAIWDRRQQRLFCARDHMGFCPFYYHETAQIFVFASDIKGVLAVEGVPYRVDEEALFAIRYFGSHDLKERTPLYDVRKLPPATTLTLAAHSRRPAAYWRPEDAPMLPKMALDDYAEQLRAHLNRSIAACLRSAFPIGSHLSGGLDSSSITVLANRQLRAQGRELAATYSWSPPPKPEEYPLQDERALIEAVCTQEELRCNYVQLTADDVAAIRARNPITEPTETLHHESVICRQASQQNIRTLLSGWGGDEIVTFDGAGFLAELFLKGRWPKLLQEMHLRSRQQGSNLLSIFKGHVLLPLVPDSVFRRLVWHPLTERRIELSRRQRSMIRRHLARTRTCVGVRRTQLHLLDNAHLTKRIESWAAYAMEKRIEYRYPLLDRRLLDYCLGLPAEMTFQQGWKRYHFRYALHQILPDTVVWRIGKRDDAFLQTFKKKAVWQQVHRVGV